MVSIPASALPHYTTSFIGRTTEISEIALRLHDPQCRLLTLVGAGGSGKTRLAIEAAQHLLETFSDVVYFVALQPIQSADHVLPTVIEALPLQASHDSRQHLLDYLQNKRLLLVIDNFEHVLAGAALLADILDAAPEVKFLTTSRESLKLREEWLYEVDGLDYPARSNRQNAPESYSAVQLFIERARRLRANRVSDHQYADIVEICQLVEGMPLALELASGWTRAFSCKQIAHELRHNLEFLSTPLQNVPERHRSMQAVFQHSWNLLTEDERRVMQRFAVFRGGCTREAAEQVAGATVQTLAALVDKSLLRYNPESERYDIQELLRQYMGTRLEQSGEADAARDAHADYFATSFHAREISEHDGPLQGVYWDAIGADLDNIRAAWDWGLRRAHYEVINKLADVIWTYYINRSHALEALEMFTKASNQLAACTDSTEQAILGRLLARRGKCENTYGYFDLAEKSLRKSMAIAQAQNDSVEYYYALRWLANTLWLWKDRNVEAWQMTEECATFYRQHGDTANLARSLEQMAGVALSLGRIEENTRLLYESLQLYRAIGHAHGVANQLQSLGRNAMLAGRWDEAERYLLEAIPQVRTTKHLTTTMDSLSRLGWVAVAKGDFSGGRNLIEEAMSLCDDAVRPPFGIVYTKVFGLFGLAVIADTDGLDEEVERLLKEAFARIESGAFPMTDFLTSELGWILCSVGQIDRAIQCLCHCLRIAQNPLSVGEMLYSIAVFVRVLAHQGDYTRATELLGLLFTHPNSPIGFLEKHPKMMLLRVNLEDTLGTADYAAVWERGTRLDVEQVARDLLRDFDPEANNPIAQANRQLPNPLTERELEVLALLAEALTNTRIAERLFIETGTVKGHVNKILQKLDAADRHEAVQRAHDLNLI